MKRPAFLNKKEQLLDIWNLSDGAEEDISIDLISKLLVFLHRLLVRLFDQREILHE
jgi:hypothetical protein